MLHNSNGSERSNTLLADFGLPFFEYRLIADKPQKHAILKRLALLQVCQHDVQCVRSSREVPRSDVDLGREDISGRNRRRQSYDNRYQKSNLGSDTISISSKSILMFQNESCKGNRLYRALHTANEIKLYRTYRSLISYSQASHVAHGDARFFIT